MENTNSRYNELLEQSKEKRELHRRRVLKSGEILFNMGYSSFACKVKNVNETGVMLECASTVGIPNEFDFRMGDSGTSVSAKLVWRTRTRLGVTLSL